MADISRIARVNGGVTRNFDLTSNSLVMSSLKLGTSELTKAKLDLLAITTDSGTAVDASAQHHHDGRYRTQSALSSTGATSGADLIGTNNTPTNYSAAAATVQDHLEGIDSALATAGGTDFSDSVFRISDNTTPSKKIAFEASGISASTVRTITMPDANVDLGDIATNNTFRTNLGLTTNGNGASLIGIEDSAAQFTSTNVEGALAEALDAAQAAQSTASAALPTAGGTMSGAIAMGTNKITGLGDPTAAQDAATKSYVDSLAAGLDPKASVRVATTAVLSGTMTANNVAPTTGNRSYNTTTKAITWFATQGPTTIDGVTLANGDRILIKDESATSGPSAGEGRTYNGIYVRTSADVWTRAEDHDGTPVNEVSGGNFTFVEQGTVNENDGFVLQGNGDLTVDTDNIVFTQFSSAGAVTASTGLTKVGSDIRIDSTAAGAGLGFTAGILNVNVDDTGIEVATDTLQLKDLGVATAKIAADAVTGAKIRLDNNEALRARNAANNADVELFKLTTEATATTAPNSGANLIKVGTSIIPNANASYDLGSLNVWRFRNVYLSGVLSTQGAISASANSTVAGVNISNNIAGPNSTLDRSVSTNQTGTDLGIFTMNTATTLASGAVFLETGNQSGTAVSGEIVLQTGTAAGAASGSISLLVGDGSTEGDIIFLKNGATAPADGDVWTAIGTSGSGYWATPAPVDSAKLTEDFTAGETLTAGNRALRMADAAETAGRVYFADNDASTDDNFYVIGLVVAAGETAGNAINGVVKSGPITMTAHGFTLGRPVYLGAGGALTSTAPTAVDTAVVKVGIARDANTVEVQIQTMGVN